MVSVIKNKKKILADVELVLRPFSQRRGLMFSAKKNLIFAFPNERKVSLHMWFVFRIIDVVFMDSKQKVVEIRKRFRPFMMYWARRKAKFILETPAGFVDSQKIKVGDQLSF